MEHNQHSHSLPTYSTFPPYSTFPLGTNPTFPPVHIQHSHSVPTYSTFPLDTHIQHFHLVQIQHFHQYIFNISTRYVHIHFVHIQHFHLVPIFNTSTWYKINISTSTYSGHGWLSVYSDWISCMYLAQFPRLPFCRLICIQISNTQADILDKINLQTIIVNYSLLRVL